jgi:hypothetical protein
MRCNSACNLYTGHLATNHEYFPALAIMCRQQTIQVTVFAAVNDGYRAVIDAQTWNGGSPKVAAGHDKVIELVFPDRSIT